MRRRTQLLVHLDALLAPDLNISNHGRGRFLLLTLSAGLGLMLAGSVTGQTFTTLHSFTGTSSEFFTNRDGAYPDARLIVSGSTLYGTALVGGNSYNGTVFAINTDGTGFTTLHNFIDGDGALPLAGLILLSNTLFGTASAGGSSGWGTVFAVNTDGTAFMTLHSFATLAPWIYQTNSEGVGPVGGLTLTDNTLYGTAEAGGGSSHGTVFKLHTDGTDFSTLYSFTALTGSTGYYGGGANSDGASPLGDLVSSGNVLYGTASTGGSWGNGTVFAINTDGTDFTNLHNFAGGSDGANPYSGLILSSNTLYGTVQNAGNWGNGALFKINTDGTAFTNLYSFTPTSGPLGGYYTNEDGAGPAAGLILWDNTLYGAAVGGGDSGHGTIFKINTDGTGFATLHSFTAGDGGRLGFITNTDGAYPHGGLILSGNTLYGTAQVGGSFGHGTVFSILLRPHLSISSSDRTLVLTWPISFSAAVLLSTTNLSSSAVWTTNSPQPVVVNGQYVVTNDLTGTQQFFRLSQ